MSYIFSRSMATGICWEMPLMARRWESSGAKVDDLAVEYKRRLKHAVRPDTTRQGTSRLSPPHPVGSLVRMPTLPTCAALVVLVVLGAGLHRVLCCNLEGSVCSARKEGTIMLGILMPAHNKVYMDEWPRLLTCHGWVPYMPVWYESILCILP